MPDEGLVYFDTSALAKWYLNESRSDDVEAFIQAQGPVAISTLTILEMRALLSRRRREHDIDVLAEARVFATFEADIRKGYLVRYAIDDEIVVASFELVARLGDHPIRSLDALHLAIASEIEATSIATADRIMARAGAALGLAIVRFY